jgi:hypothetical protein
MGHSETDERLARLLRAGDGPVDRSQHRVCHEACGWRWQTATGAASEFNRSLAASTVVWVFSMAVMWDGGTLSSISADHRL